MTDEVQFETPAPEAPAEFSSPPSPSDKVLVTEHEGVLTVLINRPEVRNCVDRDTAEALRAAFHHFEDTPRLRVAILSGVDGNFCAGADLSAVGNPELQNEVDPDGLGDGPMGPSRMALTKPLIAAVDGYAVAGGLELALLADFRVASEGATFGVFCRRWGVPLIDGGTVRLPRVVGLGRAMDLILTGRAVDTAEAHAMGLVNYVAPQGGALSMAKRIAATLVGFPNACMTTDRASVLRGLDAPLDEALRAEGAAGAPIVLAEGQAGAARFAGGAGRHGSFGG